MSVVTKPCLNCTIIHKIKKKTATRNNLELSKDTMKMNMNKILLIILYTTIK